MVLLAILLRKGTDNYLQVNGKADSEEDVTVVDDDDGAQPSTSDETPKKKQLSVSLSNIYF